MKNLLKIGLIVVLLLKSGGLFASEGEFLFKVKNVNEKLVSFSMNETQIVHVGIYEGATALYEQNISGLAGSTKTFDLSAFPEGNYIIKIAAGTKTAKYKVLIQNGKVSVSDPVIVEKFKPVFTTEDEIVTLNLEHAPKGPIEVQILDRYNDPLYSQVFEGGTGFTKKFKLAGVNVEALTFLIKSEDQEVKEVVQMY